tara:strand:+ start:114 stop:305 length:192 start_codon:yes stop_codon:yes gene_type:complete
MTLRFVIVVVEEGSRSEDGFTSEVGGLVPGNVRSSSREPPFFRERGEKKKALRVVFFAISSTD